MIMCFNELGCGQAAMKKFSAIMCIPGMANRTYRRLSKKVGATHAEVTATVLSAAVLAVRDAYAVNLPTVGDPHIDSDGGDDAEERDHDDQDDIINNGDHPGETDGGGDTAGEADSATASDGDDTLGGEECTTGMDSGGDNGCAAVDVVVSFDGTWHKRGFTSNYGVGIVIDVMSGLVLDFEVLSKYCLACSMNDRKDMTELEREEWKQDHQPRCEKNYD